MEKYAKTSCATTLLPGQLCALEIISSRSKQYQHFMYACFMLHATTVMAEFTLRFGNTAGTVTLHLLTHMCCSEQVLREPNLRVSTAAVIARILRSASPGP